MRKRSLVLTCSFLILLIAGAQILQFPEINQMRLASSSVVPLKKVRNGLVQIDNLNAAITQQQFGQASRMGLWTFGGHNGSTRFFQASNLTWVYSNGTSNQEPSVTYYEDGQGFHIGLRAESNETFSGFYAQAAPVNATLFHVGISSPIGTLSTGESETGLYVQGSEAGINYVTCVAFSNKNGTKWEIVHATGLTQATHFQYLWIDKSANQPNSADCTLITNGNNSLDVYLFHKLVYQNDSLSLGIQKPFVASLELETTDNSQVVNSSWNNYYSALDQDIAITNVPNDSVNVSIFNESGALLASAPVVDHTAVINVARYDFPISGYIGTYNSNGTIMGSSTNSSKFAGGDVYEGVKPSFVSTTLGLLLNLLDSINPLILEFVSLVAALALVGMISVYWIEQRNSKVQRS